MLVMLFVAFLAIVLVMFCVGNSVCDFVGNTFGDVLVMLVVMLLAIMLCVGNAVGKI